MGAFLSIFVVVVVLLCFDFFFFYLSTLSFVIVFLSDLCVSGDD